MTPSRFIAYGREFVGTQHLAVGTVPANFSARQNDLETEVALDLFPHLLQQVAEEFLNLAAAQTNDVSVLLLKARFIIVLVARVVHEVQLVNQSAGLEQLQRPVDSDAVDFGIE